MGLAAFNRMRRLRVKKEKRRLEQERRAAERAKLEQEEKARQEAAGRLQAYCEFMKKKAEQEAGKKVNCLSEFRVEELKVMAREKGVDGYSRMKKDELIGALEE